MYTGWIIGACRTYDGCESSELTQRKLRIRLTLLILRVTYCCLFGSRSKYSIPTEAIYSLIEVADTVKCFDISTDNSETPCYVPLQHLTCSVKVLMSRIIICEIMWKWRLVLCLSNFGITHKDKTREMIYSIRKIALPSHQTVCVLCGLCSLPFCFNF